jgi:hypothetical protein
MAKYGDKINGLSSLFGKSNNSGTASSKFVSSASLDSLGTEVESAGYIRAELQNKERVEPVVDFSKPENFSKYGSAEEYYKTSIERIYKTYPYDGSKKEKIQWSLSSSYLDNYIFENEYPRTNGFISVSPFNGGLANSFTNNPGTGIESYTLATSPQYISVKGGPNQASLPIYDQGLNKSTDFKNPEHKANFYDTANNRAKNITINGTTGNTVEFWFRSEGNLLTTKAIYDAWNSDGTNETQPGSASYGRMLLESRFEISTGNFVNSSLFHFTYHSGTTGAERVPLFPLSVIGTPVNDVFNHFAVTVKNSGNQLNIKSFLNGNLIDDLLTGSAVLEVTGASAGGINANIGAYRTYPTEYVKAQALGLGTPITDLNAFGNMTASFDEFRVWKTARTHKQIGTNWFTQVGAGTNTDTSNTNLGFYFKFNEGIVGETTTDQVVLDYSGRVSNGLYNNYASTSRSTGSAIVLASAAEREFKDPILYPDHSDVTSYKTEATQKGREWDYRNPTLLFNTLPGWIQDEDTGTAKTLTQIMASYFDTLHLQIEEMPKLKTVRYLSSSVNNGVGPKPFPYASKLLTNSGFIAPEIFADTDVIAALSHRDDNREFERKLYDIKNYIYQNVYNNLSFINKSKGTTKSIRNLIRCFGVDEEIYKINMYADNAEYSLSNNFVDKTIRKTYADFNNVQRNDATVYTYKNTSEANNSGFVTGSTNTSSGFDRGMAMTVESEVILPKKLDLGVPGADKMHFTRLTSSLFGMHSAKIDPEKDSDAQTVMTWDANDYANFQVYAVSDTTEDSKQSSKSVKFILKSYNSVLPELTSSVYFDQYKDTKWNFAVRVKPVGYPNVSTRVSGATGKAYDVEFEGYSVISDIVLNHFIATGSIANAAGLNFITQKKRLYAGAHRTNFTGSAREYSDALVSSCRYWADNVTSDELKSHAIDPLSIGVQNAEKNAYLFVTKQEPAMQVPRLKTLVLNWEFDTVTGSDGSGQFVVKDSSYTINQDEKYQNWDNSADLENLLEANHDARGDFFQLSQTASVSREYLQAYKQQSPENINNSNMITVATTDDLTYTKNTLPIKFTFALEKSMYQTISEDMVNFFYASKKASALENLIGDPVNKYRMNYKSMEKARSLFFNTVGNTPDLEKYLNYYKWLDESISKMVEQLVPVSANLPGVRNVVEGHMLDRGGKYQSKFPTMENKINDIEDAARGINEMLYDWEHGHAPTTPNALTNQDDNCLWWNKRALRDESGLSSGDSATNTDRMQIHSASVQVLNRNLDTTVRLGVDRTALRKDLNKRQIVFAETPPGTGKNIAFNTTTFSKPVNCDDTDKINPQFKFKPQFKAEGDTVGSRFQGQMVSPVVFYSSSAKNPNEDPTGYFKTTQHLQDYYSETKDIPMQGPFTEQHVGGYQYRHTGLNIGVATTRQEGWYTTTSSVGGDTFFIVYNPSAIATGYPRAGYSRDHIAKSYVNIKNIKNVTSSNNPGLGTTNDLGSSIALGNYSHDYEIVQIPGRSINNKYFIENSGILTGSSATTAVRSVYDREIPNRGKNKYVFVNRFSAPGSPETMGAGYLDVESESFSVYNALPFRNLAVRSPLKTLLTRHSLFGGHDSVAGSPSASFQKTQRNGAKRLKINGQPATPTHDGLGLSLVTGTTFDNGFVQHMIPQSDMQYAWITASALTAPFGYAQPNPANASMASTDITFVSQSQIGIWNDGGTRKFGINSYQVPESQFIAQDFSGMNKALKLVESQMAENTVQYESNNAFAPVASYLPQAPASTLNTGLLRSNGATGNPSWAQVRQSYNPIVRDMKRNNRLSLLKTTASLLTLDSGKAFFLNQNVVHSYTEPPISSKYKPLNHRIQAYNDLDMSGKGVGGDEFIIKSSYGNNLAYFTATNSKGIKGLFEGIVSVLNFQPEYAKQVYDDLKRIYLNSENNGLLLGSSPVKKASSITYREVVYPKESFTFLKKTRMRENYTEQSGSADFNRPLGRARTFWRDYTTDRLRSIGTASTAFGTTIDAGTFKTTSYENVIDLSCWPLDANYPIVDIAPTGAGGVLQGTQILGSGEGSLNLPADISLKSLNGELSYNNGIYNLYRVPIQGLGTSNDTTLNGTSPTSASISYEYPNFSLSGSDPNTVGANYTISHLGLIPKWTANLTSSRNPWFDSYEDYSKDIRRIGKDYTIVPEFRITDHMDYYLKEGFTASNKKFLDLIGSSLANTSSANSNTSGINTEFYRVYSHSDFLKHFEVIRDDHKNSEITSDNYLYTSSRIKLTCKGIKKLLPYQGFYPALRTVQLGQLFSSSYGPHLTGNYDAKTTVDGDQQTQQLSSLIQPFFAPGIMFNTVKSGIAVDWPVITGSLEQKTPLTVAAPTGVDPVYGYRAAGMCHFHPDWRMPFEAIYEPEKHLPVFNTNDSENLADRPDATLYHIWPNYPNVDLGQSNQARRYSNPGAEEFLSWYSNASYSRPTPNFAWKGEFDSRYNLAMNNFLAETIDFFIEDQQVTKFVSRAESEFKPMVSGTTYFMDVVLSKTDGFKMYEGPDKLFKIASFNSGSAVTTTSSVGSRGMHYGPNFSVRRVTELMGGFNHQILSSLGDPGPAPYTPPYFYGTSVARIAFRPHALRPMDPGDSDKFTLSEIFSSAEIETRYINLNENSNGFLGEENRFYSTGSAAYNNQMHINSSVNIFERTGQKFTSYAPLFGRNGDVQYIPKAITNPTNSDNDVWIIESKFECPTLDFSNHSILNSYANGDGNERDLTTGMWRTFGQVPNESQGVFLQVKNPFEQITNATKAAPRGSGTGTTNPRTSGTESRGPARQDISGRAGSDRILSIPTTGSLIEVCGFEPRKKRVGAIASSKQISEAIVAIPMSSEGKFISIPNSSFTKQLQNLVEHGVAVKANDFPGVTQDIEQTSVSNMIQKMKKFVIPPHLDFLNNMAVRNDPDVGPFAMYIFEFTHTLSKNDLSLIWQNMMPDISVTAKKQEVSIEHSILTGDIDFFGTDPALFTKGNTSSVSANRVFPQEMKWMVFKVKQRAKNNYSAMLYSKEGESLGFDVENSKKTYTLPPGFEKHNAYGYNWPYDFFSLVELAQIEAGISLKPKKLMPSPEDGGDSQSIPGVTEELDDAYKIGKGATIIETTQGGGRIPVDTLEITQDDIKNRN